MSFRLVVLPERPRRSARTRWPLVAAAAAAVGALVLLAEAPPRFSRAATLIAAWRSERARLAGGDLRAELSRLDAERRTLRADAGGALEALPRAGELSAVLGTLTDSADSAGVEVVEVEPGEPTPEGAFETLPIRLVVRGPTHAVGRFLSAVERSPSLLKVRAVTLAGPGLQRGPVTADVDVDAPRLLARP